MTTHDDKAQQESPGLGSLQPTANQTGFDFGVPTYRFQTWVDSYDGQHPLLDVGCGLGTNTLTALKAGASVVAVDASEEHLEQLRKKAPEAVNSGKLQTAVGDIPDGPVLPAGHYSGVLCAQLIHFLRPSQIPATFEMLCSMVKPGGNLVLTCSSIYQLPEDSGLIPKVEDAVKKDPASFPGWFLSTADFKESWSKNHTSGVDEVVRNAMPDSLHGFLPAQVEHQARAAGFEVVECGLVAGEKCGMPKELSQSEESPYAAKEDVYLVARKPATGRPPSS